MNNSPINEMLEKRKTDSCIHLRFLIAEVRMCLNMQKWEEDFIKRTPIKSLTTYGELMNQLNKWVYE